jgi:hypothetical protein
LKNKIILSGLFLTTAISCSAYRPLVLTNAFLDPASTTEVDYEDLNFQNALFNQYASGLSFTLRLNYSSASAGAYHRSFGFYIHPFGYFNNWTTITNTFSEGECIGSCKTALANVLFDRDFEQTTKKAKNTNFIQFAKFGNSSAVGNDTVNLEIKIRSSITYNVNVGSLFLSDKSYKNASVNEFYMWVRFYKDNLTANTFLLHTDTSNVQKDRVFDLSTILTGINSFDLWVQWVDFPPFEVNESVTQIYEFNLFTQNSQISIPDDVSGNIFGFEFVAVEWWDILGHLQNFAWWIVNKSPISPIFVWIDTYIITWISGLITFVTGVFNL